ncbi:MAG: hypothetical protein IPP07_05150 [Holophagales bacterium]|nr:hypothetical protein [Holophagales bacterium]
MKMIAMIGAFVGPGGVLLTLFTASITGTVIAGLPALLRSLSWRAAFNRSRLRRSAARGKPCVTASSSAATAGSPPQGRDGRRFPALPRKGTPCHRPVR